MRLLRPSLQRTRQLFPHLEAPAGAQLAVAHPAAPPQAVLAQLAAPTAAQTAVFARPVAKVGAHPAVFVRPAAQVGAQPSVFAKPTDQVGAQPVVFAQPAASTKVGAPSLDYRTCAPAERPLRSRGNRRVHAMGVRRPARTLPARKELVRTRVHTETLEPATEFSSLSRAQAASAYSNSTTAENTLRAPAESAKNSDNHRAITCLQCGKSGHVASACNSDVKPARKCYGRGGVGHIARDCSIALRSQSRKRTP